MDDDVEARIDDLYGLPLERFVAERDALVKELRRSNRRDESVRVAGLAKPSVAAWAVNQVVRTQPRAARALWDAGDDVLDVQARVVAGEATGADLRGAVERERAALASLADAARGLVTGTGRFLTDANAQAVTETLHAAAVDAEAREVVAAGRAVRPLRLTGVGQAGPPEPPARTTADQPPAAKRLAERDRRDAQAEEDRRRAERVQRTRRTEAQRALVRAETERDRARERVRAAAQARDAATARLQAAMKELGDAEDELGRAEQALARGHEVLERSEAAVEAARDDAERA